MGVQAESWLSKRNPTTDHCECHPRSPLCPPIRGLDRHFPPACLAYIPSVTSQAARQSQSRSINITQQLCVFVEDYIFKRTLGERGPCEESNVTNNEVAPPGVQKAEALTLGDPAVWENQPTQYVATWLTVLLSSPQYSPFFLFLLLSLPNHFHSLHAKAQGELCCQVEITHQKAKY